jgi:hypothetical protein
MFVWILIPTSWIALLMLILHDATKDDSDGSAISNAAGKFKALAYRAVQLAYRAMQKGPSDPAKVATTVEAVSSSSDSIQQSGATANSQASVSLPKKKPRKKKWWHKESRTAMTAPELELAIRDAVKTAAPGCEDFIGVIVRHTTPKSHLDANWDVRGVKFGKADRPTADEALASVVGRMRREFLLADN